MIDRISELPLFGPEEQINKFINIVDEEIDSSTSQIEISQDRLNNLDGIYQKQLIWSYGKERVNDAYFYQDWCPFGATDSKEPYWRMEYWGEDVENLNRSTDRVFDYKKIVGYTASDDVHDDMLVDYDASEDMHALEIDTTDLDISGLRHNIMRSYLEVSEWLGDAATEYGSENGFVSRKMSLKWLFNSIKALINWKLQNSNRYSEVDIATLSVKDDECFLPDGQQSPCGIVYNDATDLTQANGHCAPQYGVRSRQPELNGKMEISGNIYCYGERGYFYTHNSFLGECRFFHNARFLGQTVFDKEIAGTVMRARWSGDIAEMYESDSKYEPGTLVMFNGEKEITCSDGKTCNAVVTEKPGVILNGQEDENKNKIMVGIALTGIVPILVSEKIKKFDRIVPSEKFHGQGRRKRWYDFFKKPIGIALEDSDDKGKKVKCVTKMEF